jgi:hypothetical protein
MIKNHQNHQNVIKKIKTNRTQSQAGATYSFMVDFFGSGGSCGLINSLAVTVEAA